MTAELFSYQSKILQALDGAKKVLLIENTSIIEAMLFTIYNRLTI